MGSVDAANSNESKSGMLNEDFSAGRIKLIERYLIISIFALIVAVLLIAFGQLLIAGCLILAGASIWLVIFRKMTQINRKYLDSIISFLKTDSKKDKIITDFSHKIREPLNNLVITGELFTESDLNTKQKELLETFVASTKSMVTTVNELTMQSAENMSYESRKQIRFNILSAVEHVIELYRLKDSVGIQFKVDSPVTGDLECIGDPVSIKQIFLDIFNRIEKENPGRSTKVSINLKSVKSNAGESLLTITLEADTSMLLIDEKSTEGSHAARLLYLSRGKYVQEAGKDNAKLSIYLSIKNVIPEAGFKEESSRIKELIRKERIHKEIKDLRVLLVEDNVINQKITLLTLKPLVHSIDSVTNGREALDMFGTNNYDLILMDIQMPVMNGLVATEKIRALESATNSHVPIIAITANAMIGDKEKCLSAGADDYISKPFQPVQLVEKIKQVI
ncbi:MAG TPA: response regulator [Bacteroidales bacterium]|nr:response regulator [Bacteroidales bacterium]